MEEGLSPHASLDVLIIGPNRELRPEFDPCNHSIFSLRLHTAENLKAAVRDFLNCGLQPDVIILVFEWPGQYSVETVEALTFAAPLARVVCQLGSWCQGISTTKSLDDFAPFVWEPVADLGILRESTQLAFGHARCSLVKPITATREERLTNDAALWETFSEQNTLTGVVSTDPHFRQWICEVLEKRGETPREAQSPENLDGSPYRLIWDLAPWQESTTSRVRDFLGRFPDSYVIGVLNFPRREHRQELRRAGVPLLLAKPFLLANLFWALDQTRASQQTQTSMSA